jgi:tetratricopeptide (TPR) repeat protein
MQKLPEAREHAELGARVATESDTRPRQSAHELLARIALMLHDPGRARAEAALTRDADPRLPMPSFVEARLLYDQHEYAKAMPLFERALNEQRQSGGAPLAELHYYAGDTYARLERYPQAEEQFAAELRDFPNNVRARVGAAMLYRATGKIDLAGRTIDDMLRITPTPESYALAERLWNMFGNPQKAEAVRAGAQRAFGGSRPPR